MYEMCKVWKDCGTEVTVITSPYDKSDIQSKKFVARMNVEGINLIVINAGDSNKYGLMKRAFKAVIFALVSSYYAITIKADVLIASSGPITIGIPGILGKMFSRKKLVFEVRDLWPGGAVEMGLIENKSLKNLFFWFERKCYFNCEFIVPCSTGMERNILERYPKIKSLVIPNACDINLFQREDLFFDKLPNWLNTETKVFLYAGSLGLMDACDEIIEGFNKISNKENTHLVFVGDGTERNKLEDLSTRYNLNSQIHFVGLIPKTEVVKWYKISIASFVVFKNFSVLGTSSPNKMFDSLAAGVPIIQNTTGWIKDLVEDEKIGINVLPNNPLSMAHAIEYFIKLGKDVTKFRKNSFLCARTTFDRRNLSLRYHKNLMELK
jgi:glycosyltransferase involved in cell wall biosynthesis